MWPYVIAGGLVIFFLAMVASDRFRTVSNEIWHIYIVNFILLFKPPLGLVVVVLLYLLLQDGALLKLIQAFH